MSSRKPARKSSKKGTRQTSFLDVQGPRPGNPTTRQNLLVAFATLIVFGALCYGAYKGVRQMRGSVYSSNDRYAMLASNHLFESSPGGIIGKDRFFQLADLNPEANLFDFDLGRIRERMLANPAVEDLRIKRDVVNRALHISVKERVPIARLENGLLVDGLGLVIRRTMRAEDMKLPLIKNLTSPNKRVGLKLSNSLAKDAIDVLNVLRDKETAYLGKLLKVKTIFVNDGANLTLILANNFRIKFPRENPTHYLDRSAHALEQLAAKLRQDARWRGVEEFDWTHGKLIVR